MTAASVKNLPQYLLANERKNQNRLLENQAKQKRVDQAEEKKQMSSAVMAIANMQSSGASPEERNQALPSILEPFNAEARKMILSGAEAVNNQFYKQQDRNKAQSLIDKENEYQSVKDSAFGKSPEEIKTLLGEQEPGVQRRYATDQGLKQQAINKNMSPELRLFNEGKENSEFAQSQIENEKKKTFSPPALTKLFNDMDALPEGDPRKSAYKSRIDKLTTDGHPEVERIIAQRVIDGKLDFNSLSRRGGQKGRIASIIAEIDPEYNLINQAANVKFKTDAGNLKSIALINGVQPLFDEFEKQAVGLGNTKYPLINKVMNLGKEHTGDPKIVAFNNLRDDIIAETERIIMGGGVLSDSKFLRAVGNINSAQSGEQLKAALKQIKLIIAARKEALENDPYIASSNADNKNKGQVPTATNAQGETIVLRNGKWEKQ